MGAFEYVAVDAGGREKKGLIEGDTARTVRQTLRDRQLLPLKVTEVAGRERKERSAFTLRRSISPLELALVTRQLATLVRSGMPLEEALQAVSEQSERPRLKSIMLGVRARVIEGHPLEAGLSDFPQAFPEIYRATVAAGEQSGHLDGVLERLADYTESRQLLRQKVQHAMIYPTIVTIVAVLIVAGLLTYVVPQIVGVFANVNQQLPLPTRILIGLSDFLRQWGLWLLVGMVAGYFGFRYLLRREGPKRRWDRFLLRLPLIGRLNRGINTARFTSTLSILAGSGVPVLEALRIAGGVVTNVPMREAVREAAIRVREGAPIGKSLAASRLFPPMTIHLISSGESSGALEEMLERSAKNQEREMDSLIATMLGTLEPIMILVMGVIVLAIVLSILLPIFELNRLVS
ncbi:MAG: type II secretion system inner membrane protein GspF [Gammaproteobacteria bacterium]|nr:type II secretion system inner membrane protein GspF [Gammaproteobacteria bacterium]NNF62569.1 type II secretion system inner membrane protein GspF [Gammaproteobacteria bacterium]NNM20728.1 type II secretion system inner membrane protein GspF [Gammaproteobacteria bacterium]